MDIEDYSTQELRTELERREAHNARQRRIFEGEAEDTTDGDDHIERHGGTYRGQSVRRRPWGEP